MREENFGPGATNRISDISCVKAQVFLFGLWFWMKKDHYLYLSVITKPHRLDTLNNKNVFFLVWKFGKFKIKANSVSLAASLCLLVGDRLLSVFSHGLTLVCGYWDRAISVSLLIGTLIQSEPHLNDLINLNYFIRGSISKYSCTGTHRFNIWILMRNTDV